jgi:hypothetical protein
MGTGEPRRLGYTRYRNRQMVLFSKGNTKGPRVGALAWRWGVVFFRLGDHFLPPRGPVFGASSTLLGLAPNIPSTESAFLDRFVRHEDRPKIYI